MELSLCYNQVCWQFFFFFFLEFNPPKKKKKAMTRSFKGCFVIVPWLLIHPIGEASNFVLSFWGIEFEAFKHTYTILESFVTFPKFLLPKKKKKRWCKNQSLREEIPYDYGMLLCVFVKCFMIFYKRFYS